MTRTMTKFYYTLCCLICMVFYVSAQEQLRPLSGNPNLIYGDLQARGHLHRTQARPAQAASLFLPFLEDFSYADTSNYPDPAKWSDSLVYINAGYPIAPPSIGVATFDGLNKYGYPYQPNLVNLAVSLPADTLTSQPINLFVTATSQTLQPSDSVGISFYYQARGYGDAPELNDSLILDLYKPRQKRWEPRVWFKLGNANSNVNDTTFKYVFAWASDTAYLHDGFRFRFRAKASPTGAFDNWHVDYVIVDKNRSQLAAPNYNDLTFAYVPTPFLTYYSAMPWEQYSSNDMATKNRVAIKNNYNQPINTTYESRFFDKNNNQLHFYTGNSTNLGPFNPNGYSTFPNHANPTFGYTFPNLSDSADFRIEHKLIGSNSDFFPENNKVTQHQRFRNYYALDDGSAEAGYYINATQGRMAIKTIVNSADSFIALRVYIDPVGKIQASQNSKGFRVVVWAAAANDPNSPGLALYTDTVFKPRYYTDKAYNTFSEYRLRYHRWLNPGIYYIGIQQFAIESESDIITVGFDRNTDHREGLFYDAGAGWTQSQLSGALMMRPVFGKTLLPPVGISETLSNSLSAYVYPNPASDMVFLGTKDGQAFSWVLRNALGQEVASDKVAATSHRLETTQLAEGIYFLSLLSGTRIVGQHKLVVQH